MPAFIKMVEDLGGQALEVFVPPLPLPGSMTKPESKPSYAPLMLFATGWMECCCFSPKEEIRAHQ